MNIMNHAMRELVNTIVERKILPPEMRKIIKSGFINKNDCIFLKKLVSKKTNVSEIDFIDKTGYECFINSLHIDDYVESDFLSYAVSFIFELFKGWKQNKNLQAIISIHESGAVVKLYEERIGESWIASNIEDYEEAILAIDSQFGIEYLKEKGFIN